MLPPAGFTTGADAASAGRAISTTRRSQRRRSASGSGVPSRCWTSTRITATGRRRSSTSGATCSSARCTWIQAPAGSRTSSASRTKGAPAGRGANLNLPLEPGANDEGWLEAVGALVAWALDAEPGALVVSLGVDAAEADPESPLRVSVDGFREAGRMLGAMDLPTVLVQEGGYDLESLGALVGETLAGVEEGLP